MRSLAKLFLAALALGCNLWVMSAQATDVSTRPLKVDAMVKPNLIFGMDDSGSMDIELLFNTNDGELWWDLVNQRGWQSNGTLVDDPTGLGGTNWGEYFYLFPNGVSTANGQRLYGDTDWNYCCFAVPPTKQFAFARSSSYNKMYYDYTVDYAPWSKAYYSGATQTFANATATAAKSHPAIGTATFNLTVDKCGTATGETFRLLPGMKVDKGMYTGSSSCGTLEAADRTISSATSLAMQYYPATYWVPQACTVSTNDLSCAYAPDGTTTLKRYEIKSGNTFPSGRTYAAEMQNFANWWQYYRKRKTMLAGAMGQVLEPLTGMRLGVVKFNSQATVTMYDTDAASASGNRLAALGPFYLNNSKSATPTRSTLKYIGEQFMNNSSIIQYACQRNNAFIITDGYADNASSTPPSYSQATWGSGAPYATTQTGTLADLALGYYTVNLAPAKATGKLQAATNDANTNLHMNTYGLTLGSTGTIWQGSSTATPAVSGTAYSWPNPFVAYSPKAIDDLWHATINGRGQMYLASTPDETAIAIQTGLTDMLSLVGAQSAVAVSSVNLTQGDGKAYLASYNTRGWVGGLTANAVNSTTGAISTTATWDASALLTAKDWTTRVIATSSGGTGVGFTTANVGSTVNNDGSGGNYGATADVMNYLRGSRSGEGTDFRRRYGLMGAVINAEPVVSTSEGVVYMASGEGMLHAFSTSTGQELWAYVPSMVLPNIGAITDRAYSFDTLLDGTPTLAKVGAQKILIGGMGTAGSGYYALNVTSPGSFSEAQLASAVMWEFPAANASTTLKNQVGLSVGRPVVVKTASNGTVALVTSGYNAAVNDGTVRLFVLNATTGALINTITANDGASSGDPGLAQVSGFLESDGTVRYVYGGDEQGNLWRFDLVNNSSSKVATLKDGSGNRQPITAAPEVMWASSKRVVLIGTGRMLGLTDFSGGGSQSFYAIADGTTLTNARSSLVAQTYTSSTDTLTSSTVDWSTGRGWYMDLPASEQANTDPTVEFGNVVFTTNKGDIANCAASSRLYVIKALEGAKNTDPTFTPSFVGKNVSSTTIAKALVVANQRSVFAWTHDGNNNVAVTSLPGKPTIAPKKNTWKQVQR